MPENLPVETIEEASHEPSEAIKNLILAHTEALEREKELMKPTVPKIHVSEFASRMAFLYEKVRNFVGNEEKHLFRKNAIRRIMHRRNWLGLKSGKEKELSKALIQELIWGRYLENNKVPAVKIDAVAEIVKKYRLFVKEIFTLNPREKKSKVVVWVEGVAACEIEECVAPSPRLDSLTYTMYEMVSQNINLVDKKLSQEEKEVQIFIGVHRAIFKSDRDMTRYQLLKFTQERWLEADDVIVRKTAEDFSKIKDTIESQLKYPLRDRIFRVMRKKAIAFRVTEDVIEENPNEAEQLFSNPTQLLSEIRRDLGQKYQQIRSTLHRSMVRSILYVFITKISLALIIEIPFDKYYEGAVNYFALGINVITPPLIMFIVTVFIRVPSDKNTERIIKQIDNIVFGSGEESVIKIRKSKTRGFFLNFFIYLIYLLAFIASFGLIIYALRLLDFNVISIIIFLLFLCMIAYFGFRIRQTAREWVVLKKRERAFSILVDFFAMPIVRVGRWISVNFSKVNIFVFILDFIFEAPFKVLVQVVEEWLSFIREKKEEIQDQERS